MIRNVPYVPIRIQIYIEAGMVPRSFAASGRAVACLLVDCKVICTRYYRYLLYIIGINFQEDYRSALLCMPLSKRRTVTYLVSPVNQSDLHREPRSELDRCTGKLS